MNGRLNKCLSDAPWDIKRKARADHSVLFLNKQLVYEGPETCDEDAIEKRALWLHERAVKMWLHRDGFEGFST